MSSDSGISYPSPQRSHKLVTIADVCAIVIPSYTVPLSSMRVLAVVF